MTQVTSALPGQPPEREPVVAEQAAVTPDLCDGARRPALLIASSLFALTKPRIIELLLVTTLPVMLLARHGIPSLRLILVTLAGGALAAGCANTVNCVVDRDIDAVMRRTSRRPLVASAARTALVRPAEALTSAAVLAAGATLLLGLGANGLAALWPTPPSPSTCSCTRSA